MTHPLLLLPDAALFSLYCHKKSLTDKRLTTRVFLVAAERSEVLAGACRRCLRGLHSAGFAGAVGARWLGGREGSVCAHVDGGLSKVSGVSLRCGQGRRVAEPAGKARKLIAHFCATTRSKLWI